MWFEGRVEMSDFPARFAEHMTAIPKGKSEPMWRMVSSNIGHSVDDDGYIFHSRGSSGKDNLYIGVKNALHSTSFVHGHRFFIMEEYLPNIVEGQNGTQGASLYQGQQYQQAGVYNSTSANNKVNYKINISEDRVIIVTSNGYSQSYNDYALDCIGYYGLMKRYSDEKDSSAMVITSSSQSDIRVLRDAKKDLGVVYLAKSPSVLNANNYTGWNRQGLVTNIPLYTNSEGYRGELDGILTAHSQSSSQTRWRTVPTKGKVTVNQKNYECFYNSAKSPFSESSDTFIYLITRE